MTRNGFLLLQPHVCDVQIRPTEVKGLDDREIYNNYKIKSKITIEFKIRLNFLKTCDI